MCVWKALDIARPDLVPSLSRKPSPHSLGFEAVQIKVSTRNVMWASDWTVFCPFATRRRTRISLINHKESVG